MRSAQITMTDRPLQTQKRLFGNTALLSLAEGVSQLVNFAFVVSLARVFGREVVGVYAFSMAVGAFLSILISSGTLTLVLRKISREPDRTAETTGALLGFQICLALVLVLVAHVAARLLNASPLMVWGVTLIVGHQMLIQITQLFVVGFMAREEMLPVALLPLVRRVTMLLLAGLAMICGGRAEFTLLAMPVAALLTLIMAGVHAARRFGSPRLRLEPAEVASYLAEARPFFFVVVLSTLYSRLGIVYLTVLGGQVEAGLFASAERLVVAAGIVQAMFAAALFPVVSRLWETDRERFAELTQRAGRLVMFLALPVATLLTLFARDIVGIFYGEAFSDATGILAAVAWVLVVRGIGQLLSTTAQAADQQSVLVTSRALGLIALTLASLALIPRFGGMGLVVAMLASEILAAMLSMVALQRARVPVIGFGSVLRVVPACVLAAGLAYLVSDLALWLRVFVVAGGGAAALWICGAIRGNDLAYLRAIVESRKAE
jgi:O-antigen/teichoic acid export membrane protein